MIDFARYAPMRSLVYSESILRITARLPLKLRVILALPAPECDPRTTCSLGERSMRNRCAPICRSGLLMRWVIAGSQATEQNALPWRVPPELLLPEN
jgi:hypothetical protein